MLILMFISEPFKVEGMDLIPIIVDRFSKYGIFIYAQKKCNTELATNLFFKNVVKYLCVPKYIESNRDNRFIVNFWTIFFNLMGLEMKFFTVNHFQTISKT